MSITTGKLVDGKEVDLKTISDKQVHKCPNIIFVAEHYHDGSCDCFDPKATDMKEWGLRMEHRKETVGIRT